MSKKIFNFLLLLQHRDLNGFWLLIIKEIELSLNGNGNFKCGKMWSYNISTIRRLTERSAHWEQQK